MQMQSKLCKRDDGSGLSLPEDVILEVLLRLPAKALCRFQCVSKGWRAIISDPSFVAAQRSRATGPFIVAVFGSAPEHELRLLDKGGNVLRVFDVGAPALLAPTRLDLIFVDRMELGAMIIDPASGRDFTVVSTTAPPPSLESLLAPPYLWYATYGRYYTSTDVSDYSFGRAVLSGDYKVLRFRVTTWNRRSQLCEVATIMDVDPDAKPTWRQRSLGPFMDTSCLFSEHKATVNGVLYFMIDNTYPLPDGRKRIAAFDLEIEEWKPENVKGPLSGRVNEQDKWHITITELKGSLCMVHNVRHLADDLGDHYATIWLLKDPDRSVWVKEYKIQVSENLLLCTKPLDVLVDGRLLLLNTFWKAGDNKNCHRYILQLYNSSTKTFTDYMEMAEGFNGTMAFYTGGLQS